MILLQQTITAEPDSVSSITRELTMLRSLPVDDLIDTLVNKLVNFAIDLAIAIIVFYIGKFIIHKIFKLLRNILTRRNADRSLMTFTLSMVKIVLYFVLIVTVIGILGIETSSFIALFGAAGVAIGMALSGTLQNFAGGVLILLLKPYKVGDYIETQGYAGYVREIQIFHTIINTYDNKAIIIPNGGLSTGSINNWSREEYRRVEWDVSISYGDSVETARKAILDILAGDDRVVEMYFEDDRAKRGLTETLQPEEEDDKDDVPEARRPWYRRMFSHHKAIKEKVDALSEKIATESTIPVEKKPHSPSVCVDGLGDSSVNLVARAWTRTEFYWPLYYAIYERIYTELPGAGVHFPFPQLDIHVNPNATQNT